jgi:hypothetical protein
MKNLILLLILGVIQVQNVYSGTSCENGTAVPSVLKDLSRALSSSGDCVGAIDLSLSSIALYRMYDVEEKTLGNFNYHKKPKAFSTDKPENREILRVVVELVKEQIGDQDIQKVCPSVVKTSEGYRHNISDFTPMLGEPLQDPCFSNYISYVTRNIGLGWDHDRTKESVKFLIRSSLVDLPNSIYMKNNELLKKQCLENDSSQLFTNLYDIPVFNKSRIDTIRYFGNSKSDPYIELRKVPCNEAFDIIDQQSKHWNNLAISIDHEYAIIYDSKAHPQRTFFNHNRASFQEFFKIMNYAAPILKNDGYLEKNTASFKNDCVLKSKNFKPESAVYIKDLKEMFDGPDSTEIRTNLKKSMNEIAEKPQGKKNT